jgi:hypothetical protein
MPLAKPDARLHPVPMIAARACLCLLLLAGPASAQDPQELPWSCQIDFPESGTRLWVRKDLDEAGRPLANMVGFVASSPAHEDTRLEWVIPPSGDWFARPYNVYLTFPFPAIVREGPVHALIYEDGIFVAKQQLFTRQWIEQIGKLSNVGPPMGTISYSTHVSGGFPLRIHGTTELVAVAIGPDNRELARFRFPLPDWARVDRAVREAVPMLERDAEDYRHKCGQWGGEQNM